MGINARNWKIANVWVVLALCLVSGRAMAQSYSRIIENFDQRTTLRLEGSAYDNTLVRNCKIHDTGREAVFIKNVKNVRIENCEIYNVVEGIKLSSTGSTSNVVIANNSLHDITGDAISSAQRYPDVDHPGLKVLNNRLVDVATQDNGGKCHGIYVQTSDFLIEGNSILNVRDGNGISMRSSGIARRNIVGNTGKNGMSYYSDHVSGPSDKLLIENNIVYNPANSQAGSDVIEIKQGSTSASQTVSTFVIRFNTVIGKSGVASIGVQSVFGSGYTVEAYGNLVVNPSTSSALVGPIDFKDRNYVTTSTSGFVGSGNYRITSSHPARGYATGSDSYPSTDVDGQARSAASLDAGADQISSSTTPDPTPTPPPSSTSTPAPTPVPSSQISLAGLSSTTVGQWYNTGFAAQSGKLQVDFDAIPSSSKMDVTIGLSSGAADAWTDMAAIVRFGPSGIDVRNGSGYSALVSTPYSANAKYHFTMSIDVVAKRYSVSVVLPSGQTVVIAKDYAFRSEQAGLASLNNRAVRSQSGSANISNFVIKPGM